MSLRALLLDPFALPFMQRALLALLVIGAVTAVAGAHVVLRRLAFVSDTLTHTVFPGVVVAVLLGTSVVLGALVAGVLSAVLLALLTATRRVRQDAALAVLLTSFFAVGVVLVSRRESYANDLTALLFGSVLTTDARALLETAALAVVALVGFAALHKELVLGGFDREGARALGYRPLVLDLVLNVLLAVVVVAAVRAVGVVLVIAFLVVPAATVQVLGGGFARMVVGGTLLSGVAGVAGLLVAWHVSVEAGVRLPAGPAVVLVLVGMFALASCAAAVGASRRRARAGGAGRHAGVPGAGLSDPVAEATS